METQQFMKTMEKF